MAPRPPAQLGPMEVSAEGPLAHQQKFPTISLVYVYKILYCKPVSVYFTVCVQLFVRVVNMYGIRVQCITLSVSVLFHCFVLIVGHPSFICEYILNLSTFRVP